MLKPSVLRVRQWYWDRKSKGICVYGACRLPSYEGRVYCEEHWKERRAFEKLRYRRDKKKRDKNHADWHNRTKNTPIRMKWNREYHLRIRHEVIDAYGGFCRCCGIDELVFLEIDHINNNGASHRKLVRPGVSFYLWLRRNNFPKGFQVLCKNCNWAKFVLGKCPHELTQSSAASSAS